MGLETQNGGLLSELVILICWLWFANLCGMGSLRFSLVEHMYRLDYWESFHVHLKFIDLPAASV